MGRKCTVTFILAALMGICVSQFTNQNNQFVGNAQQFPANNAQQFPANNAQQFPANNQQQGVNPQFNTGQPGLTNQLTNQNFPAPVQNQQGGTFPTGQQGGAFPPAQQGGTFTPPQQGGFQPNNQPGGFPGQQPGGFPNNAQPAGFPGNQQQGAFPPTNNAPGTFPAATNTFGMNRFQTGGFNTIGNNFGNPFVANNNNFGQNPFLGGGQDNTPFTASGQLFMSLSQNPNNYRYATCYFNSTANSIRGRADMRQFLFGDSGVDLRIQVVGLPNSPVDTQRGIHIHEFGDVGENCARVGPHFNPLQTRHGGRNSFPFLRHAGDLGNMLQSPQGVSSTQFRDNVISLQGRNSILGRSLVIKYERDDEGTGTNSASQMNGNARTPLACCVIGRASPANWGSPYTEQELMNLAGLPFQNSAVSTNTNNQNQQGTNNQQFNNQNQGFNSNNNNNQGLNTNTNNQGGFNFIGNQGKKK